MYAGCFSFGAATQLHDLEKSSDIWLWKNDEIRYNGKTTRKNYAPPLVRLKVRITDIYTLHILHQGTTNNQSIIV